MYAYMCLSYICCIYAFKRLYIYDGKFLFLFFSINLSFVSEGPADDIDRGGGGAAFQGGGLNQGMNQGGDPGMEIYELYSLSRVVSTSKLAPDGLHKSEQQVRSAS